MIAALSKDFQLVGPTVEITGGLYRSAREWAQRELYLFSRSSSSKRTCWKRGAVARVSNQLEGFYSRIFLVPKKWGQGQFRQVINLRPFNRFVKYRHFKMEGIAEVRDLLQQGDG